MTQEYRARIRDLQDRLIALCDKRGIDDSNRITGVESAPTIRDLRACIYPEWEDTITAALRNLERN